MLPKSSAALLASFTELNFKFLVVCHSFLFLQTFAAAAIQRSNAIDSKSFRRTLMQCKESGGLMIEKATSVL